MNSEFLTGTAGAEDDVLAHLCEVGDKLGYPLYVYADGTCGTTPVSPENKFPFTLVVKKKFVVNQMVLETEEPVRKEAKDADNATDDMAGNFALAKTIKQAKAFNESEFNEFERICLALLLD